MNQKFIEMSENPQICDSELIGGEGRATTEEKKTVATNAVEKIPNIKSKNRNKTSQNKERL